MDNDISRSLEMSGTGAPEEARVAGVTGIDRREAIKRVTVILGGFALGGTGLLDAVERAHVRARAARPVGDFTAQDVALLDEVADTILPDTKTPGAKAAHTGPFMAVMVTDTYDDQQQAIFRDGMQKLNAAGFMTKTAAERLALLEQLDREQSSYMKTKAADAPPH